MSLDNSTSRHEPIRVLCVFGSLDRGGSETMCMNLYRHIDRSKVQFDFVKHITKKCAYEEEIQSLGGRLFTAPWLKGYNIIQYQAWWRDHLKRHPEHQIIHCHYFTISKAYLSVCKHMNRITIGHCHTDTMNSLLGRAMIGGVENQCDYRFACSEKAGKLLYPHRDFMVLKNAIEVEKYRYNIETANSVRNEFNLGDSFVLGAVGTIKKVKNPMGMIEILHDVVKLLPKAKLLWVGGDGGMRQEAEERLYQLGLKEHAIFTGVRSDVARILQGMDVFIMPSISEGIPVALIEAQAAGLPCFLSNTISMEADITGVCDYLPLGEWEKWAAAITTAKVVDRDAMNDIVQKDYNIQETALWLENFYMSLV